ncbi:unnamed protein product, partial [Arabidopsis halleri]
SLCPNPRTESEGPFTIDYSLTKGLTQHFLALDFSRPCVISEG